MFTKLQVRKTKEYYRLIRDEPSEYESIDDEIVDVLDELNDKDGVCSVFSCSGGHPSKVDATTGKVIKTGIPYLVVGYERGHKDKLVTAIINTIDSLPISMRDFIEVNYFNVPDYKMNRSICIYCKVSKKTDGYKRKWELFWKHLKREIMMMP
jgi:hypothetical protein